MPIPVDPIDEWFQRQMPKIFGPMPTSLFIGNEKTSPINARRVPPVTPYQFHNRATAAAIPHMGSTRDSTMYLKAAGGFEAKAALEADVHWCDIGIHMFAKILQALAFSERHTVLQASMLAFAARHFAALQETTVFVRLDYEVLAAVLSSVELRAPLGVVVRALIQWVRFDEATRKHHLRALLHLIGITRKRHLPLDPRLLLHLRLLRDALRTSSRAHGMGKVSNNNSSDDGDVIEPEDK